MAFAHPPGGLTARSRLTDGWAGGGEPRAAATVAGAGRGVRPMGGEPSVAGQWTSDACRIRRVLLLPRAAATSPFLKARPSCYERPQ